MKKSWVMIMLMLGVFGMVNISKGFGQAWSAGDKVLSIGGGFSNYIFFRDGIDGFKGRSTAGGFHFNMEWGIHKYVGVGLHTGVGFSGAGGGFNTYIPLAFNVNFHFYQLIADNSSKNIASDVLDIYAGFSVGGGLHLSTSYSDGGFFIAPVPTFGLRWYFAPKVALYTELSPFIYSRNFFSLGFAFKL